ncbi:MULTISPECIES: WXG100 family type VII secretion target [Streptomyces]|uniref:WXG100 family type VII secretion target n=1 Tax=Streptomyces TaxID=1883 RepID=UPI00292CBB7F|nr:WXG100 family type VII secretion target [Streptomyces sp. NEAU-HV9]
MAISGADLDALNKLVTHFKSQKINLESVFSGLNSAADESHGYWTGPLADKFRHEWTAMKPHLQKIVDLLHEAHQASQTHHDIIRRATAGH